MKTNQLKKIIGYLLPFIFMIVLLYLTFRNIDLKEVLNDISEASIFWLIIFLITFFFSHLIRAYRWKIFIDPVKENSSLKNLFSATMFGYGLSVFIPRLGEIYRPVVLGKLENISRSSVFGTIVIERVIDIIALGLSVLVSVYIYSGDLFSDVPWLQSTLFFALILVTLIILILVLLILLKDRFSNVLLNIFSKFSKRFADKVQTVFDTLIVGFSTIKTVGSFLKIIALTIIMMLVYGLTSYLGLQVLNMGNFQNISFEMGWVLMSISAFGVIIPTPGGTGSFHLITVSVLVNLYHFAPEISGAFAILTHFISIVSFTLSTLFVYFFVIKKGKDEDGNFLTLINVMKFK